MLAHRKSLNCASATSRIYRPASLNNCLRLASRLTNCGGTLMISNAAFRSGCPLDGVSLINRGHDVDRVHSAYFRSLRA